MLCLDLEKQKNKEMGKGSKSYRVLLFHVCPQSVQKKKQNSQSIRVLIQLFIVIYR